MVLTESALPPTSLGLIPQDSAPHELNREEAVLLRKIIIDKINPLKEGKKILLQHYVNLWETTVRYFAVASERDLQKELRYMGHTEFLGYFYHLVVGCCVLGHFFGCVVFWFFYFYFHFFAGVTCVSFGVCCDNFLQGQLYPKKSLKKWGRERLLLDHRTRNRSESFSNVKRNVKTCLALQLRYYIWRKT